ncbi:MAG: hypothetical protein PUE59_06395 [Treponema sp.]|nr:hypothetical protein [Treponema sp.]
MQPVVMLFGVTYNIINEYPVIIDTNVVLLALQSKFGINARR